MMELGYNENKMPDLEFAKAWYITKEEAEKYLFHTKCVKNE